MAAVSSIAERPTPITAPPAFAMDSAMPWPMPVLAPVTMMRLPARLKAEKSLI